MFPDETTQPRTIRSNQVEIENIVFLQAVFYAAENGCKWRKLPKDFGKWDTIYRRMNRWAKNGVWPRVLEALQTKLNIIVDVTALSLDSTSVKVHPDGTGALKKAALNPSEKAVAVATPKFI